MHVSRECNTALCWCLCCVPENRVPFSWPPHSGAHELLSTTVSRDSALCSILAGSNSADEMCFEKDEPKVTESGTTMMKWLFFCLFVFLDYKRNSWWFKSWQEKKKDKHVNENVGLKVVMVSLYCLIPVVLESGVNHYVHIQIWMCVYIWMFCFGLETDRALLWTWWFMSGWAKKRGARQFS